MTKTALVGLEQRVGIGSRDDDVAEKHGVGLGFEHNWAALRGTTREVLVERVCLVLADRDAGSQANRDGAWVTSREEVGVLDLHGIERGGARERCAVAVQPWGNNDAREERNRGSSGCNSRLR